MRAIRKKKEKEREVGKQTKWNGPPDKHKLIKEEGEGENTVSGVCCVCQTVSDMQQKK